MVGSSAPQADNSTMRVKPIGTSFRMSHCSVSMEAVVSSVLLTCPMSLTDDLKRDSVLRNACGHGRYVRGSCGAPLTLISK